MKAVIAKSDLLLLISKIQNLVPTKPAIHIISNILVEAIDDQLIISATDLTTSMRSYCSAKVVEEGAIALPGRRFFQLVRELTSPQVKLSAIASDTVEILSGSSSFKVHALHKNEYPSLPEFSGAQEIALPAAELKELLLRLSFAAARNDSRLELNGVLLQIENSNALFLATDGKKLAKISHPLQIDPSFSGSYILPIKAVDEMINMLDESKEPAVLSLLSDKICLEFGNLMLITKLITGLYPDVCRVIPQSTSISVNLHREELITLLRQVSLFTSEKNTSVRFFFHQGQLQLSAASSEIGEGNVSMAVDYTNEPVNIAFNPFYFLDILRHSVDETIKFSILDSYNPGIITDSSNALFVIMPMRLEPAKQPSAAINEPEKAYTA